MIETTIKGVPLFKTQSGFVPKLATDHMPFAIAVGRLANVPIYWWSPPGVGKTAVSEASAELTKHKFLCLPVPGLRSDSLALAVPDHEDHRYIDWRLLRSWPFETTVGSEPWDVLLDEFDGASPFEINFLLNFIQDRRFDRFSWGPRVYAMAAGNGEADTHTNRIRTAALSRFAHVSIDTEHMTPAWRKHLKAEGATEAHLTWWSACQEMGDKKFAPESFEYEERATRNRRTFTFALRLLNAGDSLAKQRPKAGGLFQHVAFMLASGTYGVDATAEMQQNLHWARAITPKAVRNCMVEDKGLFIVDEGDGDPDWSSPFIIGCLASSANTLLRKLEAAGQPQESALRATVTWAAKNITHEAAEALLQSAREQLGWDDAADRIAAEL